MIILITFADENPYTKVKRELVSHGYDMNTGRDVIIPQVPPESIGYYYEPMGEWVLSEQLHSD